MSKHQVIRTIRAEIGRVNHLIDLKIIKGVSYRREAQRHKFLMAQLARLEREVGGWGWFREKVRHVSACVF